MDVKATLAALGCVFFFSACALPNLDSIFPNYNSGGNHSQSICSQQSIQKAQAARIPNQFVVQWADGHFSVEKDETDTLFVEHFVKPHLAELQNVDYDQVVKVQGQKVQATAVAAAPNWGQGITDVAAVQSQGVLGQGVLVAVVDTPIDYTHPDLQGRLVQGWDFISNSPSAPVPADHATHIAGVIAANQGGPVVGLAPQASVMGVSFMDSTGSGTLGNAILAMQYAASHGAKIINNSWGGPGCTQSFQSAMQAISDQGVLLMVAAGNDGVDISQVPSFPAAFNFGLQITVAASDENDLMTSFSNSSWTLVHVAAPGQDIYSTIPGGYGYMAGTSMATPFLSGAAALLYSSRPNASPAQIKQALLSGVDAGPFRVLSQGRLNVQKALQQLQAAVQ